MEAVLEKDLACGVWEGDRLIAFVRAVTDGRLRAYVEDVVVDPDFHRQEVGKALLAKLLEGLTHIDVISLFCEPELVPFYETNGFKQNRTQVVLHRKGR